MTNIGKYTDEQLLVQVAKANGFKDYPVNRWLIGVRSKEDNMTFDDKFYLFEGKKCLAVTTGTTNKGNKGTAVIKSNEFTYDCYMASDGKKVRHHKGKMPCLRQIKGIPYQRDYSADGKTNPTTTVFKDIISTNFHACTYDMGATIIKKDIGGWSEGCLVCNNIPEYLKFLKLAGREAVSLVILDEF